MMKAVEKAMNAAATRMRRAERKTISNSLLAWRSGAPGERRRLRKILPPRPRW